MKTYSNKLHPDNVLYGGEAPSLTLASCEHIAGSEVFINKSLALQSTSAIPFDVTLDLEDGAPAGDEKKQLDLVVDLLSKSSPTQGRIGVRVHDVRSPFFHAEVSAIRKACAGKFSYVTIPKVESLDDIRSTASLVGEEVKLHVLIETHKALAAVHGIAAHPSVEVLDFGLMDFVSSHRGAISASAMRSPEQFDHKLIARAKSEISAAAHAFGKVASHNVTVDLTPGAARADALRARKEFGFLRMWSIHPQQIPEIQEAMSPDESECQEAAEVLLAGYKGLWKPVAIHGRLHDRASYRYYWDILKRARTSGRRVSAEIEERFFTASS